MFCAAEAQGQSAAATLSTPSLDFASQFVNSTSTAQPVTLSSTGTAPLNITGITISGNFSQTNNCPAQLVITTNCAINIKFRPTSVGAKAGTLTISDDAGTQTVTLSGTGTNVQLNQNTLTFASQTVGTASSAQTVTLTNKGTAAVTITGISSANSDFIQSNTCPAAPSTLAINISCKLTIKFTPTAGGVRTGNVTITDSDFGSPQVITFTGTGKALVLSTNSYTFGTQLVGTTSGSHSVMLSNKGNAAVGINSITFA